MKHLLVVALGPVQEFIAAARRTQDLQAGSRLLVELAQAVAKDLEARGATLIFPAQADLDGPNKILATLPSGQDPVDVAQQAKAAAAAYLEDVWNQALPRLRGVIDLERARAQLATFLECYVAWSPLGDSYAAARREVEQRLAGRKALRDFPAHQGTPGVHKSPLDPSRESVLAGPNGRVLESMTGYPLWLKETEMLDAISLLKRLRGATDGSGRTPSTSTMAIRAFWPWLQAERPELVQEMELLVRQQQNSGIDLGEIFFAARGGEIGEEWERQAGPLRRKALQAIGRRECPPYFAILVADGDRMGALLEQCDSPSEHVQISRNLAGFARQAQRIVTDAQGHLVYSGGDDVLAFLPVPTAISCARQLAGAFATALPQATLSGGIAIVHHREPLQFSLERARQAERLAKGPRNALAVALHTRGGAPLSVCDSWTSGPEEEWRYWTQHLTGELARGAPYELQALAREFDQTGLPHERLQGEVRRILNRKEGGKALNIASVTDADSLRRLADRMVIARFLATYERRGGNV